MRHCRHRIVLALSICELHLEQPGRDIEHPLARIHLLAAYANGVDEVGLATA